MAARLRRLAARYSAIAAERGDEWRMARRSARGARDLLQDVLAGTWQVRLNKAVWE